MRTSFLICAGALLAACAGCGSEVSDAPPDKKDVDQPPRIEKIDVASLPKLEEGRGVDDDRIDVARPAGWSPDTSRLKGVVYLCRQSVQDAYPRIYVFAEDYPDVERVTAANVQTFAASVRSKLELDNIKPAGDVTAVIIGDFAGAAYRRRARVEGKEIERLLIVTVSKGRKYTLELHALPGTLAAFTPFAQAMAKGMNFSPPPPADDSKETSRR
jgi:hypothetical protein